MKTIFKDMKIGIKHANSLNYLPYSLETKMNLLPIRVLRFVGGLCFAGFILIRNYPELSKDINSNYILIMVFLGTLQMLFISITMFLKLGYVIYHFWKGHYEVWNSPVNRFAGITVTAISCFKGVCYGLGGAGTFLGTSMGTDWVLQYSGWDPVMGPNLGKVTDKALTAVGWEKPERPQSDLGLPKSFPPAEIPKDFPPKSK